LGDIADLLLDEPAACDYTMILARHVVSYGKSSEVLLGICPSWLIGRDPQNEKHNETIAVLSLGNTFDLGPNRFIAEKTLQNDGRAQKQRNIHDQALNATKSSGLLVLPAIDFTTIAIR